MLDQQRKDKAEQAQLIRQRAAKTVVTIQDFLNTPGGREFTKEFNRMFDSEVLVSTVDPIEIVKRAAQQDCVRWIEDVRTKEIITEEEISNE